jgi:hypothetical protein
MVSLADNCPQRTHEPARLFLFFFQGVIGTVTEIWVKEGWRTFYRGLGPALIGIIPYAAIDLTLFETLKTLYVSYSDTKYPSAMAMLVCSFAGFHWPKGARRPPGPC